MRHEIVRQALEDYLRVRRRLGFQLKTEQPLLESFVEFMEQAGAGRITSELAVKWAMLPQNAHPHRWGQRLSIVRVFARYVATLDPDSEVPSVDLLPARRARVAPYIYSPAEITALMKAAGQLTPPVRAALFRTVIGLMATTGLRLGEALGLDRLDVDLTDGPSSWVAVPKGKVRDATRFLFSGERQRGRRRGGLLPLVRSDSPLDACTRFSIAQ